MVAAVGAVVSAVVGAAVGTVIFGMPIDGPADNVGHVLAEGLEDTDGFTEMLGAEGKLSCAESLGFFEG